MKRHINIGDFSLGEGNRVFIVAELSANHNGSLDIAIETIRAAKRAGADAIKLQTYTPGTITLNVKNDDFRISQGTIWDGKYLYELYEEAYTPWEWHEKLFAVASECGLICFSSPFDKSAVDFLAKLNVPAYKIASFEITDIPLIEYVAAQGKPVIISLGIAEEADIELALDACRRVGNNDIILLRCTSSYPAPPEEINAVLIQDIKNKYGVLTGLSDHTLGLTVPVAATTLGAVMIEKHLILNKSVGGPDASFSLDEKEFAEMTAAIRIAEKCLGKADYTLSPAGKRNREFSRSLYVACKIIKGERITALNVRSVRPGFGLHPKYLPQILGKKVNRDLEPGTRMSLDYIDNE